MNDGKSQLDLRMVALALVLVLWIRAGGQLPDWEPSPGGKIPAARLRVAIVEETTDRGKLPKEQAAIFLAGDVDDWMVAHAMPRPEGFRLWDKDIQVGERLSPAWKAIAVELRKSTVPVPSIHVIDGERIVMSAPLPKDVPATIEFLNKYGG